MPPEVNEVGKCAARAVSSPLHYAVCYPRAGGAIRSDLTTKKENAVARKKPTCSYVRAVHLRTAPR